MKPFSLKENILFSYRRYAHFVRRSFWGCRGTQARCTPRRFAVMLVFSAVLLLLQSVHWLAFLVDDILFRGYRSVEIRKPLFIVGVPRSGTTFLHRLLASDHETFTTLSLWELIFAPTVSERKVVQALALVDRRVGAPLKGLIERVERAAFGGLEEVHRISLFSPEEDYFTLVPIYACYLMILPFPFHEDLGHLAFFDDQTPEPDKERIMGFYKTCLQRHLYVRGTEKILLSKNVSFGPMVDTLSRVFPDCRVIGTVRDPLRAVPSHLSSMLEGAAFFDNDTRGDRFRNQMIDVQRYAYTHLSEVLPRLPRERHRIIRMEDLRADLEKEVTAVYQRFHITMTSGFRDRLRRQTRKQKVYRSRHRYDPAWYNLSEGDIVQQFSDVYHRFGYKPPDRIGPSGEDRCAPRQASLS